ncbi:MAG: hypothetical protein IJZ15_07670 [Oscillospiraceae bacterium]|nr:hypothetical protein [Oscillospiraceae bacterium]
MKVKLLGIVFISLGILHVLAAGLFFLIYRTFEHNKNSVAKVTASLIDVKHKKDVPVYGQRFFRGPIRVVMKIKNYSKGKYEYQVNQKHYTIRYIEFVTSKQMPRFVSVVYIERFPKIAYVKTDINNQKFDIYSIVLVLFGVLFMLGGCSVLF